MVLFVTMARSKEEVKRLQEKVQSFFDTFPEIPIMFIEQTLELTHGHINKWIERGKLRRPENLAVGHGWKYAGEQKRDKPGKPPPVMVKQDRRRGRPPKKEEDAMMGVVAPPRKEEWLPPPPPVPKDLYDDLPDYSVDELRRLVKKQMGASIRDGKQVSAYAQALKSLMEINAKERALGMDDEDVMHSYVPDEDLGPEDE